MERAKTLESSLNAYEQTARREHHDMLKRKQMIEKRKEHLENLNIKKVKLPLTEIFIPFLQDLLSCSTLLNNFE